MREARDNAEVDVANHVPKVDQICHMVSDQCVKNADEDDGEETEIKDGDKAQSKAGVVQVATEKGKVVHSLPAKDRMTAAFVLDYLKHHGHTAALESTRSEMTRRSWIPAPNESSATTQSDETLATINDISRLLSIPGAAVPLQRIGEILHPFSTHYHRMAIYHLVYSIQDTEEDDEEDMRVIAFGQDLHQKAQEQPWAQDEVELLEEAFGLLAIELDEDGKRLWAERRLRDTELLDSHLRGKPPFFRYLNPHISDSELGS